MRRRELLTTMAKVGAGTALLGSPAATAPLRRINTVLLGEEGAAAATCGEDRCTTRDACTAGDAGHVCRQRDVCDVDESGDCTRDECVTDVSKACTDDLCESDSSGECTGDTCRIDSSGPCSGDVCTSDSSDGCMTSDQCAADSSGACETSDACVDDSSGACLVDRCSNDKSGACLPGDSCVSDKSGGCQDDTCASDSSKSCIHDQCVADSSGTCEADVCASDSSEVCTRDSCAVDYSGACFASDECESDKSDSCQRDHCGSDASGACTAIDVCVADKSLDCGTDLCRSDSSPACGSDTCAHDLAAVLTRRSFTRLNRALRWLYEVSAALLLALLAAATHAQTGSGPYWWAQPVVNLGCAAAFYPHAVSATAQTVNAGTPKGPFLGTVGGILRADVDGNGLDASDPEVKDDNGDGTRTLPAGTRFEGTRTYTTVWIPDDVAILATGFLKLTASQDVRVHGVLRLPTGAEVAAGGVVDVRSSAWLADGGEVRLASALAGAVGSMCDGLESTPEVLGKVTDTDMDGIADVHESTGDLDGDGVPDWQDQDTVRVPSATAAGPVFLDVAEGNPPRLRFRKVKAMLATDPFVPQTRKPTGNFPYGVVEGVVTLVHTGETVVVTMRLPAPVPTTAQYWQVDKLGWYQLPLGSHDGDATVTVALTDGGSGDTDGAADGAITILGGLLQDGVASIPPTIAASTTLYNFGKVRTGSAAEVAITVRNLGGAALVIGEVAALNPLAAPYSLPGDACSGRTLAPGGQCLLTARFAPATVFAWTDSFDIPCNDPQRPRLFITLMGNGGLPPALSAELASSTRALAVVPAAAHVLGKAGTRWLTDLVLFNPSSDTENADLYFLKGEQDNTAAVPQVVPVGARATLRVADIVKQTFGETSASGALVIACDEPLLVASRTYNDASSGTYGQYIEGLGPAAVVRQWEPAQLLQLTRTPDYRTNIGFASLTATPITVTVTLHRGDGNVLGTRTYPLKPFEYFQETDILGKVTSAEVNGAYAVVASSSPEARYFTYASVVDNRTGDPINVVPSRPAPSLLYLPSAARLSGAQGSVWRTDLQVLNPDTTRADFTVELLKRDAANPAPQRRSLSLEGGRSVRYNDVLQSLFGFSGAATLRIDCPDGRLLASSRTYNFKTTGTFGQFIPASPILDPIPWETQAAMLDEPNARAANLDAGIGWGQEAYLIGLSQSATDTRGFRTNLGLVSTSKDVQVVRVDLYREDGTALGTVATTLRPFESKQLDKVFRTVTAQEVDGGFIVIRTETPGTFLVAYASVVDNASNDPIYVPARLAPESLFEPEW